MRICLLMILLVAGCSAGNGNPGMSVSRQTMEDKYKVPLDVDSQWKTDCWDGTEKEIRDSLVIPKSGEFTNEPSYVAYYNSARDVTVMSVYGHIVSRGKHSQIYEQNYYVTWERPGNASVKPGQWVLTNITMN